MSARSLLERDQATKRTRTTGELLPKPIIEPTSCMLWRLAPGERATARTRSVIARRSSANPARAGAVTGVDYDTGSAVRRRRDRAAETPDDCPNAFSLGKV